MRLCLLLSHLHFVAAMAAMKVAALRPYTDESEVRKFVRTTHKKCVFCNGNLMERDWGSELAMIVGPGLPQRVKPLKLRCGGHHCRAIHCCSYAIVNGKKMNIIDDDRGSGGVLMVGGKFGFSISYFQSHVHRVFRGAISTSAEAENIAERFRTAGIACPSDFWIRSSLQQAFFNILRLRDIASGIGKGSELWQEKFLFDIERLLATNLYHNSRRTNGSEDVDTHFLIFFAKRDDPTFSATTSCVADGNMKNSRGLSKRERRTKSKRNLRGKPKGSKNKSDNFEAKCKDKTPVRRPNRTG